MEEKDDKLEFDEAVLVEEGVKWFENLWVESKSKLTNNNDKLALVCHAFMLELGFSVGNRKVLPENWKNSAGHSSRYFYPPGTEFDIILTVTSLGRLVKVHGTHISSKTNFSSSKIRPGDFVTEKDENFGMKNLRSLARLFKNEVGVPLLNSVKSQLGMAVTGLLGLPPEISLKILQNLDVNSLVNLGKVSKHLNLISKEKNIWRKLFFRDFGSRSFAIKRFSFQLNHQESEDWLSVYKEEYSNQKERESIRTRVPPPPLFPFPDFENNPQNPLLPPMPGIVGGDYDRIPFGRNPLQPPFSLPRPRFETPGPNFPGFGPRRGGFGPPGFGGGGGGGGFM
eukprot:GFUD01039238.1.p1 GENE.GFUD01039238.1~~GFUD01039238.1.p1  ORF type:complete len:339 (+),score=52.44 GFUD01039238.1:374-1390(+)